VPAPPNDKVPATTDSDLDQVFSGLLAQVGKDNNRAAKALHELCRVHLELWEKIGGLEHSALESWKALFSVGSPNRSAFLRHHIDGELSRRKALHADGSSQLETLLINRILLPWLYVDVRGCGLHADAAARRLVRGGRVPPEATRTGEPAIAPRGSGARHGAPTAAANAS
jgi:hypothetical protein